MSIFNDLITELREKRLWPVAALLVLALVAVPVLLSSSGSAPAAPAVALPIPPAATAAAALPTVAVASVPVPHKLAAAKRNPFRQPPVRKLSTSPAVGNTATPATGAAPSAAPSAGSSPGSHAPSSSSAAAPSHGGSSRPAGPPTPTTATPTTIPIRKTLAPPRAGLTATQSYRVELAITLASGGLRTFDSLERLSAIPSRRLPLLVELGVLSGAHRVLFAVEPGAAVSGPGKCLPGPIDCEILSLAENQIETLSTARIPGAAQFAVTGIHAASHHSRRAAQRARASRSIFGAQLLRGASLSILSLFPYDVHTGTIHDHRSLTVGGK